MKTKRNLIVLVLAVGLALILIRPFAGERLPAAQAAPAAPVAGVIYVDRDATGANDGSSWANAYTHLQGALDDAESGDEIWVAEGVYVPTSGITRTVTFLLKNGVALYGGFVSTETARTQRDWEAYVTVLSGDLGGDDVTDANGVVTDTANIVGDNAYSVVNGNSRLNETTVLDGFTITAGNADISSYPGDYGGGMLNQIGNPMLRNITFSGNFARIGGGGMYNIGGSPTLENVVFSGNTANYGGGMHNYNSSPTLTHVTFNANTSDYHGGGMYNKNSNPTMTNVSFNVNAAEYGGGMLNEGSSPTLAHVTFSTNAANHSGGGMYNSNDSSPALTNVTFSANSANYGGGGMHNFNNSNPTMTNVTFNANSADYTGGGLDNYGSNPTLTNVSFIGNFAASYGGGIHNSDSNSMLTNVVFSGNTANYGGGMYNYNNSSPTLTNVSFSGNGTHLGGGMHNDYNSSPTLTNVSFSGNYGGGIYSRDGSTPTVHNTLFVKVEGDDNCGGGAFASGSAHNLADDASCGDSTTQSETINLGTLSDYGGDTQTVPLLPGSDAIDAGDAAHCPAADQRGAGRAGPCDIGAFEAQGFTLAMTGGDNQSAAITNPFPQPLRVIVASNATPADPVDGGTVTFTAPSSGASTNPSTYIATITDSKAGVSVTANGTAGGPYTVTAGTAGATAGVNFTLTNVATFYLYLPWIEKN